MKPWNQFKHRGVYTHLKTIVEQVQSMGAMVSSCGEGKITILWPEGKTVYVRRYQQGPYRWLLFTTSANRLMLLQDRDPSIQELQTAFRD